MRKPLIAFGLAVTTGLGAVPAAGVLAAPNGHGTFSSPTTSRTSPLIPPAVSASTAAASNSVSGAQIVQTALKYIGFPYTTTGNSPSTGFSCIGFVSYVYRSNGIALPGDLGGALAFAAQVPFSDLQPGDILYFQNTLWTGLSHAAIYIGNGKFIHAEYYGYGVRISSFYNDSKDGNYWITKYLGANRPWAGVAYAPSTTATPPGESPPPPPALNTGTQTLSGRPAVVDVQSLHVRTGPSTKYTIQAVVRRGTSLTIIGRARGWYKVQLPSGAVGWVARLGISTGSAVAPKTSSSRKNPNIGRVSGPARTGAPALSRPHASASIRVSGLRVHS
ncbi:MAG: NlpC/P60 family protein, partial [Chloroflexota bacterium]